MCWGSKQHAGDCSLQGNDKCWSDSLLLGQTSREEENVLASCQPAADAYLICQRGDSSEQEGFSDACSFTLDNLSQTRKKA